MNVDRIAVRSLTETLKIWVTDLRRVDVTGGRLSLSKIEQQRARRVVMPSGGSRMIARR